MTRETRRQLWLAGWVVGFAVAMACLLLAFKYHGALDTMQRTRIALVASETREVIEGNLAFGMAFTDIAPLPDVLISTRNTDSLIAGIDVVDARGAAVYSTDIPRRGHPIEPGWREALARSSGDAWQAHDGEAAVLGVPVRNSFGLVLGHVVVRYSMAELDHATRAFARYIALRGLAVAAVGTLVLFLLLRAVRARLERRLARLARAYEGEDAGSGWAPGEEAVRARRRIEEARAALEAAAQALEPAGAIPAAGAST